MSSDEELATHLWFHSTRSTHLTAKSLDEPEGPSRHFSPPLRLLTTAPLVNHFRSGDFYVCEAVPKSESNLNEKNADSKTKKIQPETPKIRNFGIKYYNNLF